MSRAFISHVFVSRSVVSRPVVSTGSRAGLAIDKVFATRLAS